MKVNVDQLVRNLDGSPYKPTRAACPQCGSPAQIGDPMTVRSACVEALSTPLQSDREKTTMQKMELFDLAQKIYGAGDDGIVDLTAKEITVVQERVNQFYLAPPVVAQVHRMLEPKEEE